MAAQRDKLYEHQLTMFHAYNDVFGTPEGKLVLENLAEQAASCRDPAVRVGREDMLVHIMLVRARKPEKTKVVTQSSAAEEETDD